jgi:hypothetical protein
MTDQLNRIAEKLNQLKELDKEFQLFGSYQHKYILNPPLPLEKIQAFEKSYGVILPKEYVAFITTLGNGGVGPYYGLEPFENCLFNDLDYKRIDSLLNPSKPFTFNESWNLEFIPSVDYEENKVQYEKEFLSYEETYYSKELMNGAIALCNFGCGINLYLIVNGDEYGHIWTDDRGNTNGIYPSIDLGNEDRLTFLNWYELWLDQSIEECRGLE